jgi:hypothetical protein
MEHVVCVLLHPSTQVHLPYLAGRQSVNRKTGTHVMLFQTGSTKLDSCSWQCRHTRLCTAQLPHRWLLVASPLHDQMRGCCGRFQSSAHAKRQRPPLWHAGTVKLTHTFSFAYSRVSSLGVVNQKRAAAPITVSVASGAVSNRCDNIKYTDGTTEDLCLTYGAYIVSTKLVRVQYGTAAAVLVTCDIVPGQRKACQYYSYKYTVAVDGYFSVQTYVNTVTLSGVSIKLAPARAASTQAGSSTPGTSAALSAVPIGNIAGNSTMNSTRHSTRNSTSTSTSSTVGG